MIILFPITVHSQNQTPSGSGWTLDGVVYRISSGANVIFTGAYTGQRRIEVNADATNVNITLSSVTIEGLEKYRCPLSLGSRASVNLTLLGTNTLTGGGDEAAINVPAGTTLTLNGTGSLTARGGLLAAGIGGGYIRTAGNITINSGTINAHGGNGSSVYGGGAGIGGGGGGPEGASGHGGTIIINGGIVTATGGNSGHATSGSCGGGNGGWTAETVVAVLEQALVAVVEEVVLAGT